MPLRPQKRSVPDWPEQNRIVTGLLALQRATRAARPDFDVNGFVVHAELGRLWIEVVREHERVRVPVSWFEAGNILESVKEGEEFYECGLINGAHLFYGRGSREDGRVRAAPANVGRTGNSRASEEQTQPCLQPPRRTSVRLTDRVAKPQDITASIGQSSISAPRQSNFVEPRRKSAGRAVLFDGRTRRV